MKFAVWTALAQGCALLANSLLASAAQVGNRTVPDMLFAVQGNELYVRINEQFEDRGVATLYGLWSLLRRHRLPDVYGTFTTISDDFVEPGDDEASHFSFWRPGGAAHPHLWPDHDYYGWPEFWIAPLPLFEQQLTREMVPWHERLPIVMWKGFPYRGGKHTPRHRYITCAKAHPRLLGVSEIRWWVFLDRANNTTLTGEAFLKPMSVDLRYMLHYKFLIYLPGRTWSSSIKRLILAGAVVLLPANNPHDSMVTLKLRECEGCVLYYDLDDMCKSLHRVMSSVSDAQAAEMAVRLAAFARVHFAQDAVEAYMLDVLQRTAQAQSYPAGVLAPFDSNYTKVDCAWLLSSHRRVLVSHLRWQLDEWFDDECMLKNTTYLRYTAL